MAPVMVTIKYEQEFAAAATWPESRRKLGSVRAAEGCLTQAWS
jgi:hypothetical protein